MMHPAAAKAQTQQAATPAPVQDPKALGAYFGSAVPNGSFLTGGTSGLSRSKFLS